MPGRSSAAAMIRPPASSFGKRAGRSASASSRYNAVAGKAAGLGLLKGDAADIDRYVTGKALDGLFTMIGDEEKKIRQDPIGTGSAILQKVFGSLQ